MFKVTDAISILHTLWQVPQVQTGIINALQDVFESVGRDCNGQCACGGQSKWEGTTPELKAFYADRMPKPTRKSRNGGKR